MDLGDQDTRQQIIIYKRKVQQWEEKYFRDTLHYRQNIRLLQQQHIALQQKLEHYKLIADQAQQHVQRIQTYTEQVEQAYHHAQHDARMYYEQVQFLRGEHAPQRSVTKKERSSQSSKVSSPPVLTPSDKRKQRQSEKSQQVLSFLQSDLKYD